MYDKQAKIEAFDLSAKCSTKIQQGAKKNTGLVLGLLNQIEYTIK